MLPWLISWNKLVPSEVPSVTHNSLPNSLFSAEKYSLSSKNLKSAISELSVPGLISLTNLVFSEVPSVTHNSLPNSPLSAVKKS